MPPLLSSAETSALLSLLPHEDREFEAVASDFDAAFEAKDRFKACCAIVLLLEDKTLLETPQRLALWYVLWHAFKSSQLADNPFVSVALDAAAADGAPPAERCLLLQLLQGGGLAGVARLTLGTFAASAEGLPRAPPPDAAALRRRYAPRPPASLETASSFKRAAISRLLPDEPEGPLGGGAAGGGGGAPGAPEPERRRREALLRGVVGSLTFAGFEPAWQRPRPPVLTPAPEELRWLAPPTGQELLWDSTAGDDPGRLAVVRELVAKALKGPLLPAQQQQVLLHLESDPKLVHSLRLGPEQLPALVENTPVVAYEVLHALARSRSIAAYYEVLASMQMSLHSMEVVNRLSSAVDLPPEFVHRYITNCIASCEGIQDKYLQNRLVRLVCVFLQSLIRKRAISIRDLLHEVQAFCINYSRIREAAGLFRLLKLLE